MSVERDLTIVIRGVGERTEAVCKKLLTEELSANNIHLIHEAPFSTALKKSYEIGLNESRKWTMVIDADVLIRPGIVTDLYHRVESSRSSIFVVQSEMLDKFFAGVRVGGIKVYRTKLLKRAIKLVADEVRPEATVIKNMHARGFYVHISDLVCGLHDFEQYYSDIFRKGFTHGIKHAKLIDIMMPYWLRVAKKDKDFEVLIAGYQLGSQHAGKLKLDKDETEDMFRSYMQKTKLKEKPKLAASSFSTAEVGSMVDNFAPPPEYAKVKAEIDSWGRPSVPTGLNLRRIISLLGR